jgi:hypothetical protein
MAQAGRFDEAMETARAIDEHGVEQGQAFIEVVAGPAQAGRLDEALEIARAIRFEPFRRRALGKASDALARAGRFEEALSTCPPYSLDFFLRDVAGLWPAF